MSAATFSHLKQYLPENSDVTLPHILHFIYITFDDFGFSTYAKTKAR